LDASVLYPLLATDPDFAAVVGHTGCGAITAALREVTGREEADERLRSHLDLLVPLVEQGLEEVGTGDSESETVNRLVEYNVHRQVEFLLDAADDTPVAGLVCDLHGAFGPETARLHLVNLEGETDRTEFPPELREFEASDSYSTKQ
ncbi:MAG: carbonic anhydrase, partial [Bradymonadaceae bacterium]